MAPLSHLKVLVVGASIAGPSTAFWLARAGANVTVIERFPELRRGGQSVDIRTIGVSTMRKMDDMEARVREKRAPLDGLSLKTSVSIMCCEQVAALRRIEKCDGSVGVDFANGSPSAEFDLVVACDGSTSRTRALGLGCGVRDHTHRLNIWSAYFTSKRDYVRGERIGYGHSATPGKVITAQLDTVGGNRVVLTKLYPKDKEDYTTPFREASNKGEGALKKYVADQFKGMDWITNDALEDLANSDDFYANEWIRVKTPTLSRGKFVLVGDAGYGGAPGAGTSLAIAGGYVLAGELCRHKSDMIAGLKAYEERMRPIFEDLQKFPPGAMGFMAPQTEWGLTMRNVIFTFLSRSRLLDVVQRFGGYFAGAFAGGEKYSLPDYSFADEKGKP